MDEAKRLHSRWSALQGSKSCTSGSGSLCGANPAGASSRDEAAEVVQIMASPLAYDSRQPRFTGGLNLVNPPEDQGTCSACVAFALASAIETSMASALQRDAATMSRVSPADLFFCGPSTGAVSCGTGWTYEAALDNLIQRGTAINSEKCLPWSKAVATKDPCRAALCDSSTELPAGTFSYTRTDPLDSHAKVMRFIREHGAVLTSIVLFDEGKHLRSFFKHNPTGIYSYAGIPGSTDVNHAVLVIGYDATAAYWVAKNSFGRDFADGGFFKVAFGQAGLMEPRTTFGLRFEPRDRGAVVLPLVPGGDLPAGCLYWVTQTGAFASRIAERANVPLEKLLDDNRDLFIQDPAALLPAGTRVKVCGSGARAVDRPAGAKPSDALPPSSSNPVLPPVPPSASAPAKPAATDDAGILLQGMCCEMYDWISGTDHCKWQGITCRNEASGGRGPVTQISVPRQVLVGDLSVAASWVNLGPSLEYIDMSGNRLRGALPATWSQLGAMKVIDLHDNLLQSTLPPSWGDLKRLEMLDLSTNRLNGKIPESYGRLTSLTTLNLAGNELMGPLPPVLASGALSKLEVLNVSSNRLSGSLPAFSPMPALASLALDSNDFVGAFPSANLAVALPKLQVLSVHSNRLLSGCLPAAWKGKVEMVDANSAGMTKTLTKGVLKGTAITGWC